MEGRRPSRSSRRRRSGPSLRPFANATTGSKTGRGKPPDPLFTSTLSVFVPVRRSTPDDPASIFRVQVHGFTPLLRTGMGRCQEQCEVMRSYAKWARSPQGAEGRPPCAMRRGSEPRPRPVQDPDVPDHTPRPGQACARWASIPRAGPRLLGVNPDSPTCQHRAHHRSAANSIRPRPRDRDGSPVADSQRVCRRGSGNPRMT